MLKLSDLKAGTEFICNTSKWTQFTISYHYIVDHIEKGIPYAYDDRHYLAPIFEYDLEDIIVINTEQAHLFTKEKFTEFIQEFPEHSQALTDFLQFINKENDLQDAIVKLTKAGYTVARYVPN